MSAMMSLQIGHYENDVGMPFWETIAKEHGICPDGFAAASGPNGRTSSFFQEIPTGRYIPRSVLIDNDSSTFDDILRSDYGRLFHPDDLLTGTGSTGSNYAIGRYTQPQLVEAAMERIRHAAEDCDSSPGIQFLHAIGGGTGSGVASAVLANVRADHPSSLCCTQTVIPLEGEAPLASYNGILSLRDLLMADHCVLYSNAALTAAAASAFTAPSAAALWSTTDPAHALMARSIANITSGQRFPGPDACGLRKIATSTVPFPRLHFMLPSLSPLRHKQPYGMTVQQMVRDLLSPRSALCGDHGSVLTAACLVRGATTVAEIERCLPTTLGGLLPDPISVALTQQAEEGHALSAVMLANGSGIADILQGLLDAFNILLHRKAFLHSYLSQGMEEMDFYEAAQEVADLLEEYRAYTTPAAAVGEDWEMAPASPERARTHVHMKRAEKEPAAYFKPTISSAEKMRNKKQPAFQPVITKPRHDEDLQTSMSRSSSRGRARSISSLQSPRSRSLDTRRTAEERWEGPRSRASSFDTDSLGGSVWSRGSMKPADNLVGSGVFFVEEVRKKGYR